MDPLYGFQTINVEAQARDPHSLLNWTRRMLSIRKQQKAFGRGSLKMMTPSNRRIFAYLREYTDGDRHDVILCVANLSRSAQAAELELSSYAGKVPVEMVGGSSFPPIGTLNYLLTLPPYGFYWFLLADEKQMPNWHTAPVDRMPELPTLVIKRHLHELVQGRARQTLEQESLTAYLPKRRWFSHREKPLRQLHLLYAIPFGEQADPFLLCEVQVSHEDAFDHFQLPLGYIAEHQAGSPLPQQLALARLRRGPQVGLLTDACVLPEFCRQVLSSLRKDSVLHWEGNEIQFVSTSRLHTLEDIPEEEINPISAEQSNSSILVGERMVLKVLRRVLPGIHPESEICGYLTEQGFANIAPLLGEVRRVDQHGESHTLMILQGYVSNQGDAWQWTQDTLERAIRDELVGGLSTVENQYYALAELQNFAGILGRRVGELHVALAQPSDNPDFGAVQSSQADAVEWQRAIEDQVRQALEALSIARSSLVASQREQVDWLIDQGKVLLGLVAKLAERSAGGLRMRVHGDLHLGQVLVAHGDAYLIDFEGEPARSLEERRKRHSPLKDVAGMLRSFDYAAAMAMRNAQSTDVSPEAEQARHTIAATYRSQARSAFYDAYRVAAAQLPHAWYQRQGEAAALALFCIEKTAYEILYESRYRPDWLIVPVQGMVELIEHLSGSGHDE
jgi:maltose alpha-D-glucosyltransferase/alpha-amylase